MSAMRDKLLVLILVSALLLGGILHASLAHSHGSHSHGERESITWSQLHSALRHEEKKPLFTLFQSPLAFFIAFVSLTAAMAVSYRYGDRRASMRDPFASRALRSGILRYRRFA
jgi:hypothetical protein